MKNESPVPPYPPQRCFSGAESDCCVPEDSDPGQPSQMVSVIAGVVVAPGSRGANLSLYIYI